MLILELYILLRQNTRYDLVQCVSSDTVVYKIWFTAKNE